MGYLDPFVRRRIAALILIAGAVVIVLAVANIGPFSDPPTESDRAQAALQEFFDAAHRKDYATVCELLSKTQQRSIESAGRKATGNKVKCSDLVGAVGAGALARSELEVIDVRVSGSLAAIDTKLKIEGRPGTELRTFKLEELGGVWRISDFGI
jgi:hypothetical protein